MNHGKAPTGTVTFLFTDIQGSTKLWESYHDKMRTDLRRHDRILREGITRHNGFIFKTGGDSFCAAFAKPTDAMHAAVSVQLSLAEERWNVPGGISVRMGIHSGETEERNSDFYGPAVNRVARLMSAAHGGQILVSSAFTELVSDTVPDGMEMADLGIHHLKDIVLPQRVFQLNHPRLRSDFPVINTVDSRLNNLPVHTAPLIGRESELLQGETYLVTRRVRLLTLVGPGGAGKTRLAVTLAARVTDQFKNGVVFVDLTPVTHGEGLIRELARVLRVIETPAEGMTLSDLVTDYFASKEVLLLLDNLEQAAGAGTVISELLTACPGVTVLATSREPLRIREERQFPVAPLPLPASTYSKSADQLKQYDAVKLFIDRAEASDPSFTVTNRNAPAVAEICVRLDGLPLAIELAAARVTIMPPETILLRLGGKLKLLSRGRRDAPERQRSIRSTIAWSYDLLDEREKIFFQRFSLFAGGCDLEAAESVCVLPDDPEDMDPLILLSSLRDKSLIVRDNSGVEPRFTMLQIIREYAGEMLEASEETAEISERYIDYYLELAETAEPELFGPNQRRFFQILETEYGNLAHCLGMLDNQGDYHTGLRLAKALGWYWFRRGRYREGAGHLDHFLKKSGEAEDPELMSRAYLYNGIIRYVNPGLVDPATAAVFEKSRDFAKKAGSRTNLAMSLAGLSQGYFYRGKPTKRTLKKAAETADQGLDLAKRAGDNWTVALCTWASQGFNRIDLEFDEKKSRLMYALDCAEKTGDPFVISRILISLGWIHEGAGRDKEALPWYAKYSSIAETMGDKLMLFESHFYPGRVYCTLKNYAKARNELLTALHTSAEAGARAFMIMSVHHLGDTARGENRSLQAVRYYAALRILRRIPSKEPSPEATEFLDKLMPRQRWLIEWSSIMTLTESQVIDRALSGFE